MESAFGDGSTFYVSLPRISDSEYEKMRIAQENERMVQSFATSANTTGQMPQAGQMVQASQTTQPQSNQVVQAQPTQPQMTQPATTGPMAQPQAVQATQSGSTSTGHPVASVAQNIPLQGPATVQGVPSTIGTPNSAASLTSNPPVTTPMPNTQVTSNPGKELL